MNILSIETSCDDTCCAFTKDGILIANNYICNESLYEKSTGVIPTLASEQHFNEIDYVINKTLSAACDQHIDIVAFTKKPGLNASLFIGEVAANTIAKIVGAQLEPVNHLHAHCYSILINELSLFTSYPVIALVISGGHTILFQIKSPTDFLVLAETTDDSIGECFDKVGSRLGFKYPGGRNLDDFITSQKGKLNMHDNSLPIFPIFRCDSQKLRFSFSGLKSHCIRTLYLTNPDTSYKVLFAYTLFVSAFKQLLHVLKNATEQYQFSEIWITGGVSASKCLRNYIQSEDIFKKYKVRFPKIKFSADNAAMVGCLTYNKIKY